ncbi:hypothetical protein CI109_102806 [Kwoniella shandongensis]|uniref:Uncharacterized protein n=1 Tax=Kwoniella shandongensis TaxID=1734106 RepID=A0A5M6BQ29_9TREE|nr:uncharacterized protein CI109_007447 [Kwoniella shandongensis]KAA5524222.1 hypothetical protein CI109_007447 [Kwoniella shandongensis]
MNVPTSLSSLTDPISLGKVQILLVPVHLPNAPVASSIYDSYLNLIKRHQTLRGDELLRPSFPRSRSHSRSSGNDASSSKLRFFPSSTGGSISLSRGASSNHVHLAYTGNGPARHTYPLSLLRMSAFPLIVLGIAVDPAGSGDEKGTQIQGYSLQEQDEGEDEGGDIGEASTPTIPTFRNHQIPHKPPTSSPSQSFDETLEHIFPTTSPFPLVKRLLVVPDRIPNAAASPRKQSNGVGANGEHGRDAGEVRYAPHDGMESWIGRILSEVVGELLGELGEIATALETPAGMRTLSSTLLPSLTSTLPHPELDNVIASKRSSTPSEYPSRPSTSTPISHPHSTSKDGLSAMGISLTRALTPGGRPTSIGPPSLPPIQTTAIAPAPQPIQPASSNPFRRSTAISSPFSRTTSAASINSSTSNSPVQVANSVPKYTSANLTGVAGGRLLKLLGDMYLLAGMYGDAIKCFDDGAERCRNVGDVLWEAAAREGRAVAGIGEAWEGRDGSNMAQPFPTSPIPIEILSHYLSALAALSRAPLPFPPTILSPSPQAVSGSISFQGPSTSNPANVGTGEGLLAYLHTGLSLRISHFVLLIWASGGWGSIALSSLMSHSLPRSFPSPLQGHEKTSTTTRRKHARTLGLLSAQSGLSRQSILAHAEQALAPHQRAMTKIEQLTVHIEVVWLCRWLDLPRKEAACTREVVKRLAIMVVEGRDETRRLGAGGFPSKTSRTPISAISAENRSDEAAAAVGLGLGIPVQAKIQAVAVRRKESTEGNSGIVALFERACEFMGIDILSPSQSHLSTLHPNSRDDLDHTSGSTGPNFGWPELQVEMIKEGVAVMESLPDHASIIRLCLSALHSLTGYLNPQSQSVLAKMYPAALATVRRRGLEFGVVPWWIPGKLVLSLEIASLSPNKLPIEHSREEIVVLEGKKDPFLYNPRLKAAEAGKTSMVANEQVDIFVTVRNPFTFDLDIQDLSILTSGVPFVTSPLPLTLPALSVQTVRVTGTAPAPGLMQVRGVSIRLTDGSYNEILLPVIDAQDKLRRDKHKSRVKREVGKVKRSGLDARFAALSVADRDAGSEGPDLKEKWLECKVVEELPLAWIKRTSLTHGTVMLYNGETSTIKITLENSSSVPIDFIKLTFDDSTAREAQAIIQEGELTPEQAYELEWDQLNRPVFTWEKGDDEISIAPGGKATISVRCLGKVGCSDGTIRIDYGCLNRSSRTSDSGDTTASSSSSNTFYTRQITFPVLFTVYHTIECHSLDLIGLESSSTKSSSEEPNGAGESGRHNGALHHSSSSSALAEVRLRRALEEESDDEHCLLGLNVRNVYGVPFEVTIGRKHGGEAGSSLACTRLVPPGATERLVLPIPRRVLSHDLLDRPVPSLSERQYIVDKEKKSLAQIISEREHFWYREELLSMIHATWVEPGSLRGGSLSLRDQYLSPGILDVFRSDGVELRIKLESREDAGEGGNVGMMEFVDLKVEVVNRLDQPLRPYVHIEPLPSSPSDQSWTQPFLSSSSSTTNNRRPQSQAPGPNHPHGHGHGNKNVLLDGVSSGLLSPLKKGEKGEWNLGGVMFLAKGKYGFRAAVEQVDEDGEGAVEGKKVWFSSVLHVDVE